jgi:hypothetical protein
MSLIRLGALPTRTETVAEIKHRPSTRFSMHRCEEEGNIYTEENRSSV